MSDMTERPDDLDELASAYLDGEVTPTERVLVEADDDLLSRVEELRAVRDVLRSDVTLSYRDRLESALAAALAVFDAEPVAVLTDDTRPTPPIDLGALRRRRTPWWKPVAAVAGAAAIGVAALSGVANLSADGDDDATTAEAPTELSAAAATDAKRAADEAPAAAETATPTIDAITDAATAESDGGQDATTAAAGDMTLAEQAPPIALDTTAQLVAYAQQALGLRGALPATGGTEEATETTAAAAITTTSLTTTSLTASCPELGDLLGPVIWQDQPADLYVTAAGSTQAVAVVATADCVVLVDVPLP